MQVHWTDVYASVIKGSMKPVHLIAAAFACLFASVAIHNFSAFADSRRTYLFNRSVAVPPPGYASQITGWVHLPEPYHAIVTNNARQDTPSAAIPPATECRLRIEEKTPSGWREVARSRIAFPDPQTWWGKRGLGDFTLAQGQHTLRITNLECSKDVPFPGGTLSIVPFAGFVLFRINEFWPLLANFLAALALPLITGSALLRQRQARRAIDRTDGPLT